MFSAKVITAVQIFQELEPLMNKKEASSSRKCVISIKELTEKCTE